MGMPQFKNMIRALFINKYGNLSGNMDEYDFLKNKLTAKWGTQFANFFDTKWGHFGCG